MAEMHVTEESPARIILEMDPEWKAETSKTYAGSLKQGRGCLGIVAIAFLILLAILWYSFSTNSLRSLPWSFWLIAVLVFIGGMLFILLEVYFVSSHKNEAGEATVTIDLGSQKAIRVEKSNSGKTTQNELKLEQVTRILVHGDDAIHTLTVTLESQGGSSLLVNSDVFFYSQPMLEFGKKLGTFIRKPVVFKITEAGKLISEETVQP
ncbi:MAG: hypothetical protein C3F07_10165 [Anaerolineales bacterium]|nr:MAG: hypothetical protein C3F07_10165 [Anaerolineales bacterium]